MSKKILAVITVALLSPALALAAYDDVSLTTSAVLSVDGHDLQVIGSTAAIESITVNASTFSVVLQHASFLHLKALDHATMSYSGSQTVQAGFACESTYSQLDLSYDDSVSGATTVTVTVSGSCVSSSGGSNSSSSGGGGGGSIAAIVPKATTPTQTTFGSGLSSTQVNAIISLLQSFGADQSVIDNVRTSLAGTPNAGTVSSGHYTFARDLKLGSKGEDIKNLQKILNSDQETRITSTGDGSPGNETSYFGAMTVKAVQKFQLKYKLAAPGSSGYGKVGPKTRARLGEI